MISLAKPEHFSALAALFATANQTAVTQCIHSGEEVAAIVSDMNTIAAEGELSVAFAGAADEPTAALVADSDADLGRAWLWGPVGKNEAWAVLWQTIQDALPAVIKRYDAFLNVENEAGITFYEQAGFEKGRLAHVYIAQPSAAKPPAQPAEPFNGRFADQLIPLHDALFPNTYEPGASMVEKQDDHHRTFILTEGDTLLGYVYATVDESDGTGTIDYLGVAEAARGKGAGRRLLQTAVAWLFTQRHVPEVSLVVDESNSNAKSLYLSAGFTHKYTGQTLRHQLTIDD